jgi:hypothetical protein
MRKLAATDSIMMDDQVNALMHAWMTGRMSSYSVLSTTEFLAAVR